MSFKTALFSPPAGGYQVATPKPSFKYHYPKGNGDKITLGRLERGKAYISGWKHYKEGGISGRSYIYLDNGEILEMEIKGKLYGDWSLSIYDIKFLPIAGSELQAPFKRKYQVVYKTSIWETSLNGYWQEIKEETFDPKRSLGRISLKKLPQVAAKP